MFFCGSNSFADYNFKNFLQCCFSSFCRLVAVNKKQSVTTGFSAKPKGKLDNAAGMF